MLPGTKIEKKFLLADWNYSQLKHSGAFDNYNLKYY